MEEEIAFGVFLSKRLRINSDNWIQIGLNPEIETMRIYNGKVGQEDFCIPGKIPNDEIRSLINEYFREIGGLVTFKEPAPHLPDFYYQIENKKGEGVVTPLRDRTMITIIRSV